MKNWKYYNHAAIPVTALLARWTTEFDCGYETNWWYVVKDNPFDINALKSKRRYEINKGIKNFNVKEIEPMNYADFQDYLEKYFGFRKAYCKLHIVYNPKAKWIIMLMFPIRRFLMKLDGIGKVHQINSVLRMEEIVRENNE